MKIHSIKSILSVLICFNIVFYPSFIYSQEQSPTPTIEESTTPTIEITPTPSTTIDTSPTPTDTELTPTPSTALDVSPTPTIPTDSENQIINSGSDANINATESSTLTVNIESTNSASIENDVTQDVNTGKNTSDNPLSNSSTTTGDAKSDVVIVNNVNQAIVGGEVTPVLVNVTADHEGEIDLALIQPCLDKLFGQGDVNESYIINSGDETTITLDTKTNKETTINVDNDATITNNISVNTNTGDNQNAGLTSSLNTGNAESNVTILTQANTTLVGDCNIFTILNLFKDQNGNIILPYELGMAELESGLPAIYYQLNVQNSGDDTDINQSSSINNQTTINTQNSASVNNNVLTNTNTGGNDVSGILGTTVVTGNASTTVKMVDMINTTIVGDRWMMLRINILGSWTGNIIGFNGPYIRTDNYIILFFRLPAVTSSETPKTETNIQNSGDRLSLNQMNEYSNSLTVNTNNNADVINNVNVTSNTGNNDVSGLNTSLKTGDATTNVNIFNLLNTTLVGNHWYFTIINIFDNFIGDIIFPRPDLVVTKTVDKLQATPGEQLSYTIQYKNIGRYYAFNSTLIDNLPSDVDFVSSSKTVSVNANILTFALGRLKPGQSGEINVMAKIKDTKASFDIINSANISTVTPESDKNNNMASVLTKVSYASPTPVVTNNNVVNPTTETAQNDQSGGGSSTTTTTESSLASDNYTTINGTMNQSKYRTYFKPKMPETTRSVGSILSIADENNCGLLCQILNIIKSYWIFPSVAGVLLLFMNRRKMRAFIARKS